MTGDGNSDPTDGIYDFIKQEAGSAVEIDQPESEKGKTPSDTLHGSHEKPSENFDEMVWIAKSELALLREENKDLKLQNSRLRKDKEHLEQTIVTLSNGYEDQLRENELAAA